MEFAEQIKKMAALAKNKPPVMSLLIDEEGVCVDLVLDTTRSYYGDWIKGEGGDICLYRDMDTKKVVGCHLPLYQRSLMVSRIEKTGEAAKAKEE